ncbi:hypothetical protein BC943DRAFT_208035 [Umbelopsis sp. AD052]|nr:hypothetical protein BC943DRAFT_208035 [Umbelopsis sp. AD052]
MGYDKLDAALAWQRNLPPAGSNIVIADTLKSNGNFLLHHFIVNHLRANQPVIVIGLSQIFNHYFLIGRKLGINLQTLKQNQQFVFIDGLTHLTSYTQKAPFPSVTTPTTPNAVLNGTNVQEFYNAIRERVEASGPNPLVIIDDANVLLWAGFSHNDVLSLLHNIRVLIESVQGTLVTVVHADEEGNYDDESDSFVRTMLSRADIVLMVEPLQSGQSRDVHGQLSIINGPKQRGLVEAQALHYRLMDNNCTFFAKGIAQGVL